ncbi:MAG TPA: hypothetical protein VJQ49_07320, partial [Casimicrobiaceae bacterium]|nr:hypothetical protein [Casimicrobiaceae bacterium]
QQAELQAKQTRAMADSARGEAEKQIVYVLDDFYLELEPVGRLDIVAALSKRAVDYYAGLPPELRTPETERNRALALVRYGAALRTQSKLDQSSKALSEAVGVLGRLRKEGDSSEAAAVGLGLALTSQARVAGSQNRKPDEQALASQAVDVLKPMMSGPNPSVPLRRAYGLALTYLGFSQSNTNQDEAAVKTLNDARASFRSIDDLKLDDLPSAVGYAEASAWQMGALQNLGRFDQVRQVGDDASRVAAAVIERRPGNMSALRARALIADTLSGTEGFQLHIRKAAAMSRQGEEGWEALVALDPSNQIAWNNLVDSRLAEGLWALTLGDVRGAEAYWRAGLAVGQHTTNSAFIGNVLALSAGYLTMLEADAGDLPAAKSALAMNRRFVDMATSGLPPQAFGRAFLPEFLGYYGLPPSGIGYGEYALPLAADDYEAVRKQARASAQRLERIKISAPAQDLPRNRALEVAYRTAAYASYRLADYRAADAEIKRALDLRRGIPTLTMFEQRDADLQQMLAAMIAVRLGRDAEAQRIIEPIVRVHRQLHNRADNDDLRQRIEFAQALYVSALASPTQSITRLREAAALIDGLPPALRRLHSVAVVRSDIDQAQKTLR